MDPLIAALLDSDDGVRWNAANSLGDLRDDRAVEPLGRALNDDDENVQKAAADALGKIRDP
ncbi:MAG TPA: HEAT repeat domain-containing protein, partial [Candidatus Acidoferrum sp.]|nr:HEAT repeat domain-containing protein [Candidatus Acidoferrum sp.]